MNLTTSKNWFLILVLGLILISCDDNALYDNYQKVEENTWAHDNALTFKIDIEDTISPCNLFINIRHTDSYRYSNLYMILKSTLPNKRFEIDTLEFILAQPNGKWIGKSSGSIVVLSSLIRPASNFPKSGEYKFELIQAMRDEELPEVTDIGMRVEKLMN